MLGNSVGLEYTSKQVPVEVVMNGKYLGLYSLSELVKIGSGGIEIDELDETVSSGEELTGGYLLANSSWLSYEGKYNEIMIRDDYCLQLVDPDPEEYQNTAQKEYITNYLL
ncbi:MAG: hypothetical protein K6E10_02725 [Eubacterium sp.]|nr:hypothetical protein [Eubacterium sp.]